MRPEGQSLHTDGPHRRYGSRRGTLDAADIQEEMFVNRRFHLQARTAIIISAD